MKKTIIFIPIVIASMILSSCLDDLDVTPRSPAVSTSEDVFKDPDAYKQALAKIYATYAISGQKGSVGGDADI